MTNRRCSRISVVIVAALAAFATPALAQTSHGRFVLGAGVTAQRDDVHAILPGVRIDAAVPLVGHLRAVGEVDVTRQLDQKYFNTNILGGLRLASGGRVSIFGQFLAGVDRSQGIQAVTCAPGGGVDVWIRKGLAIRAQIDLPFLRYKGVSYKQQFFTIGVAIPIGH